MNDWPDDIQDMIDDFAFLEDWEDRYMHVIELGKAMPPMNEAQKNDTTRVSGCVSQVWLQSKPDPHTPDALIFIGDSDAHIVKGLVAIVLKIFSGRPKSLAQELPAEKILAELGLAEHLSVQRSNGLASMIKRIRHDYSALV